MAFYVNDPIFQQVSKIPNIVGKINFILEFQSKYIDNPGKHIIKDRKNNKQSSDLRIKGNELFISKKYEGALEMYTYSIAQAEDKSENLGLAYANRSAVLFRLEFYEECVKDIERALENNYPDALKPKINERKEKALSLKAKQKKIQYYQPMPSINVNDRNPVIECASNCVEIKNDLKQGRCIIATRDIQIGEIIAVESPTYSILMDAKWCHCHHCLKLCYNLLPCNSCTKTLFCSSICKYDSISYHRYECPILATIESLNHHFLIPLRIGITMRDQYKNFEAEIEESGSVYKSRRYKEIHNLITNEVNRSPENLFEGALHTAMCYTILRDHTDFFESDEDYKDTFVELIFQHLQTMTCNFHEIVELCPNSNGTYNMINIGVGAYNFMSLFNHSCIPNVDKTVHGISFCMTAVKTIRKGEQVFDTYGYDFTNDPKSVRQYNLKQNYYFDCHCLACENNWETRKKWNPSDDEYGFLLSPLRNHIIEVQRGNLSTAKRFRTEVIDIMKEIENEMEENKPLYVFHNLQFILMACNRCFGNIRRSLA